MWYTIYLYICVYSCFIFLLFSFPDKQKQTEGNLTANAIDLVLVVKTGTDLEQNPGVVVVVEVVKVMLDLGKYRREKKDPYFYLTNYCYTCIYMCPSLLKSSFFSLCRDSKAAASSGTNRGSRSRSKSLEKERARTSVVDSRKFFLEKKIDRKRNGKHLLCTLCSKLQI